jgi:hypothetical protein
MASIATSSSQDSTKGVHAADGSSPLGSKAVKRRGNRELPLRSSVPRAIVEQPKRPSANASRLDLREDDAAMAFRAHRVLFLTNLRFGAAKSSSQTRGLPLKLRMTLPA